MLGRRVIVLDEVESTNDYLIERSADLPDGTIVIAEAQTAGRGRRGRAWVAPRSAALLFSILVKPSESFAVTDFAKLTHLASVSVAGGVEGAQIKWPNDVYLDGKKLAGILVEARGEIAVVGIGINVDTHEDEFPEELEYPAISLRIAAGKPVDRESFLCALVGRFKAWKKSTMPFADFIKTQVKPLSLLLGREIEYQVDGETRRGWAVDLGSGGELVVDPGDSSRIELNSVDQVRLVP
ncbi:MAG: BirA family biotin operon repressor/biotin-[acetyl-CoA-carboxylase] ligase [Verrucomicrobiales bacterium]|jgi:BirA family biotin operon repressor/biotin-[acetyl-CoA-carboxylase] ligase